VIEVRETFVDFCAAFATPKELAVSATVVIATAKIFFFDSVSVDIVMSPVPN
jgi:hypothetical protein